MEVLRYWKVGGSRVQEIIAYHRNLRWEYEWSQYQDALFQNPRSTQACPWPPFKEPPASVCEPREETRATSDGAGADPHQRPSPAGEHEGSRGQDAAGQNIFAAEGATPEPRSPAPDLLLTPPGLAVDEETRLARILDMFLRRGEWEDIPDESDSPRDAAATGHEVERALGDLMRYIELG
ncbi:hypothetical protein BV20DRAFT_1055134 [Pilatotrama ljubarskyi]|nr:hypothetical protein BV20DRAFT_1055134 [Pilatotrama ljubarskyi]